VRLPYLEAVLAFTGLPINLGMMANTQSVSPFMASLLETSMVENYYVNHANMYELEAGYECC
jgi:hypothetical protein